MKFSILSDKDFKRVPWKNGMGFTTELKVHHPLKNEGFTWRLSIAGIVKDGEFSDFSGYDRILVMLDGNGVVLEHDNGKKDILKKRFDSAYFSGNRKTFAKLIDGPVKDFNIIVKRDCCFSKVDITRDTKTHRFNLDTGHFLVYSVDQNIDININNKNTILLPANHLFHFDNSVGKFENMEISLTGISAICIQVAAKEYAFPPGPHKNRPITN